MYSISTQILSYLLMEGKTFWIQSHARNTVSFNSQKDAMHLTDNDWRGFCCIACSAACEDKENNSPFRIRWGNEEALSALISRNTERGKAIARVAAISLSGSSTYFPCFVCGAKPVANLPLNLPPAHGDYSPWILHFSKRRISPG